MSEQTAAIPNANSADDPRLALVSREPLNAETVLSSQAGVITPNAAFYKRNHFAIPPLDAAAWRLKITGEVATPVELRYADLLALPSHSLLVTLECAGNGRSALHPAADGEPWQYGAVSTAEWTGVALRTLLELATPTPAAREIVIEGADGGYVPAAKATLPFARSLPLQQALHPDTLLAYAMNGEPLSAEHGFPVRLVVPGWYAMAAVKWVTRIAAIVERFEGFYQVERYVMAHPERGAAAITPLTTLPPRSLICTPTEGATLRRGAHLVRGLAWSGHAPVSRVEVSVDGGARWEAAEFASEPARYAWRRWEYRWAAADVGPVTLQSRAYDAAGNTQPEEPDWNRLGYANNAIQRVPVHVL
jgi:DMSO/TMAO reductase YedYZ molybdopterin-dependent catalytic subunit